MADKKLMAQKTIARKLIASVEQIEPRIFLIRAELSRKPAALEKKYNIQFKAVFDAIRELLAPLAPKKKRPIGFAPWEKNEAGPF